MSSTVSPVIRVPGSERTIEALGERHIYRLTGAETDGALDLFEDVVQPHAGPPEHIHREQDESLTIIDGTFAIKLGEQRIIAVPGTCIFIPRGLTHTWRNIGDAPARMLMTFTPGGMEGFFTELGQLPPGPPDMARLLPLCAQYQMELTGPPLAD